MANRRAVLRGAGLGAGLGAAGALLACAGSPTTDLPQTVSGQRPGALAPAESVPPPSSDAGWQAEWDSVVASAQREGRLSVITWGDSAYRPVFRQFQQDFGIAVQQVPESSAPVWLDAVRTQRRAGAHTFDLAFVQPDYAISQGAPERMWAPIKPLLFHPEVLADAAWRDGLAGRFLDAGAALCFDWEYQVHHAYAVNTDLVAEGEIVSILDLLQPKWRGRILTSDPRIGSGLASAASVSHAHGPDVLRKLLLDQRPVIGPGGRDSVESLILGRYPIALGLRPKALQEFRDKGLASKVKFVDLPDADFVPSTALLRFDHSPHPAAARLFVNWVLTREGQTLLADYLHTNSARTDVPPYEPDCIGTPGEAYYDPDREANFTHIAATRQLVTTALRGIS